MTTRPHDAAAFDAAGVEHVARAGGEVTRAGGDGSSRRDAEASFDRHVALVARARWRQWLFCPALLAVLYLPLVKRQYRFAVPPARSWADALLFLLALTLISALVSGVAYVRGSVRAPLYPALTRAERRQVDEALRTRTRPSDALLAVVADDHASYLMMRRAHRSRHVVGAVAGFVLVAAVADTWWAAVAWSLPIALFVVRQWNATRRAETARAYLANESGYLRPDAVLALRRSDDSARDVARADTTGDARARSGDAVSSPQRQRQPQPQPQPQPDGGGLETLVDVRHSDRGRELTAELARELHKRHPLASRSWTVVAESSFNDDVIAVAGDDAVLVHLTWRVETMPSWPRWQPCRAAPGFGGVITSGV